MGPSQECNNQKSKLVLQKAEGVIRGRETAISCVWTRLADAGRLPGTCGALAVPTEGCS